jgi:hypothetical protein
VSFRLVVSDTITVPVSGRLPDAAGRMQPFSFTLKARRLPASELRTAVEASDTTVPEFLAGLVHGWSGVLDDEGRELPYSPAALAQLFEIVGMAGIVFQAYIESTGARGKEKN